MEYHKVSSAPFSKKLANSHSFNGASIYEGVFGGGPMKVRSRVEEDYSAIFGGSSSSSIPFLDVPELNESKISVDVKSSKLDYSKIFGGFGESDFTVSYEELSTESKKQHSFVKEARTAAETGSHPCNASAENRVSCEVEAFSQSVDGEKQFKMSYHRADQERKNGTNGTTHVTQLNAVPGYTCLIDEFAPSRITEGVGRPLTSAVNGTRITTSFSGEISQGKHRRKTSSLHSPGGSSKQASRDGVNVQNKCNHSRSYSNDVLFDACEIGFQTHAPKVQVPSRQSERLVNNKGDSKTSMGSMLGVSNGHSSEDATGFCSPTYFDEEVDVNSVAATSAAAVKKAIEEAQARIRIAKEIMERKKGGLQNHVKPRFKNGPKAEKSREGKVTNEFREEARQKCEKADGPLQDFVRLGTENAMKAKQATADFRESLFSANEASGETRRDKDNATPMKDRQMRDLKEEKWEGKVTNEFREDARQKCEKADGPMQDFARLGMEDAMKSEQATPDFRESLFSANEASGETQRDKDNATPMKDRQMKDLKEEKWEGKATNYFSEEARQKCKTAHGPLQDFARLGMENAMKFEHATSDFRESLFSANEASGETQRDKDNATPTKDWQMKDLKEEKWEGKVTNDFREEARQKCEKADGPMQDLARLGMENAMKSEQATPDFRESLFSANEASGETQRDKDKVTPMKDRQMKDLKEEKWEGNATNDFREEARQKCEKADGPMQDFARLGTENAMKSKQATLDFREGLFSANEASGETERDNDNAAPRKDRQMKDLKEEKWEGKVTNEFREEARQKCENADGAMQDFARLGMENAMKSKQATPDFRESLFSANEASGETRRDKDSATPLKDLKEENWGGIGGKLIQSVNDILKERIFTMKIFEKPEEDGKKLKADEQGQAQEDVERMLNVVQGTCGLKEGACEPKSGEGVDDQEEYGQKSRVAELQAEQEMTFKASHNVEACEKKQRRLWDLSASKYKLEMQLKDSEHEFREGAYEPISDQGIHDQEEYGKESTVARSWEEKEVKASHGVGARLKKQRRLWDLTANDYKLEMQLKDNERTKMRKLKDEQAWLENEKKQREVLKQKETDIRSEDLSESEEDEVAIKEICENGKPIESTCESIQFEKQQEACIWEENEGGLGDVHVREGAENISDEAREQENVEVTINELCDGKQSGKKLEEDIESGAGGRVLEAEENGQMLKEAYGMKEIDKGLEESCEWVETEEIRREIEPREEDEKMKVTQEVCNFRNNLEAANDVCEQDKTEILHENLEASVHDENDEYLEVPTHEENGEVVEVTPASSEYKEIETEANNQEQKGIFEFKIAGLAQVFLEHSGIQKQVEDTTEAQASEHNGLNTGVSITNAWQKQSDQCEKESNTVCNAGNFDEETYESEEKFEDVEEAEAAIEEGEDESNSEFPHDEKWVYNGENMEATQPPSMFQGKGESTEIADDIKTSQNIEHKENRSETLKTAGRGVEGTMHNEVELQKELKRKTDEAKEREREREKERIAVERAIREARERAFTEARERAAVDKANAEASRRATAGARERLEKASAEVNVKSSSDKILMEARLKAERTAVERATAEARARALERAMSEKATSKARNQAVKSSSASRDNGMRHNSASNDSQYRGSGPSRSTGYSNSSSHDVSHAINKSDGANGESVQRHKARLESHQRIVERAAKALAEKNKRDLLAQKEQAEKNRLAEALDIEVRRWSSGKTGNLRALLSTLQYILGPDSGWRPIPLTDLIATAAVKKAYKRATLCVHPDKLQQRGASIQQKYTCEKVFDLLKEAWNKFNAEER